MSTDDIKQQSPDSTEIFRMPSADATVPDLMAQQKPAHPVLTIVKGPQTGQTFELNLPQISLGRDPKSSVFLNDMTVSRNHATIDLSNLALTLILSMVPGLMVPLLTRLPCAMAQLFRLAPSAWSSIPAEFQLKVKG